MDDALLQFLAGKVAEKVKGEDIAQQAADNISATLETIRAALLVRQLPLPLSVLPLSHPPSLSSLSLLPLSHPPSLPSSLSHIITYMYNHL